MRITLSGCSAVLSGSALVVLVASQVLPLATLPTFAFADGPVIESFSVPTCHGLSATIYVDGTNHVVGGPDSGAAYVGTLDGTSGGDVIVGTGTADAVNGGGGSDTICTLG